MMKKIILSKKELSILHPDGTSSESIDKYINVDLFLQSCVENVGQEMTSSIVQNYFKLIYEKKIQNQ